jgi:hypothetical protein
MQTKIIFAIAVVALVAAALVGVTAAQFANQNISTVNPNYSQVPPYANGNAPAPGTNTGYSQNGYGCYGYGAQAQNPNQPQYGAGMMGNGYGYGMGRWW